MSQRNFNSKIDEFEKFRCVQKHLLDEFLKICEKYNIQYFAVYGTLLGAVRNDGYIPWDDDIDLAIWRKDVNKLRNVMTDERFEFVFTDSIANCPCNVIKFMDNCTTYIDIYNIAIDGQYGICIDIEIIDDTFFFPVLRCIKNLKLDFLYAAMRSKRYGVDAIGSVSKNKAKRVKKYAESRSYHDLYLEAEKIQKWHGLLLGKCSIYTYHQHHVLKRKWFCRIGSVGFENRSIQSVENVDGLLKAFYGRGYMKLPPKSEQFPKHIKNYYFDTKLPYKQMLEKVINFNNIPIDKKIFLWGAGNMARHFFDHFGDKISPEIIIDKDVSKHGQLFRGCIVRGDQEISLYDSNEIYIIICNIYFAEVIKRIKELGNYQYTIYSEKFIDQNPDYYM